MAFITGPRQVGKTTLARFLLKEVGSDNYFNWDDGETRRRILRSSGSFWESPGSNPSRIVLDEIHKYPRWKRFLKGFFDLQRDRVEVMVTGSGRLDIYQRGGDSLFGRYHLLHLLPFSLGELARPKTIPAPLDHTSSIEKVFEPPDAVLKEGYQSLWNLNGFPEPLFPENDPL